MLLRLQGFVLFILTTLVFAPPAAIAQPRADTIRLISPYAAGGVGDTLARRLANVMREQTGHTHHLS